MLAGGWAGIWATGDITREERGGGGGGFNVILYGHDRGVLTGLPGPVHGVVSKIGVLNAYKEKNIMEKGRLKRIILLIRTNEIN